MNYIKYIKRQDSGWKQSFGYSGETSLNLSGEINNFISFSLVQPGEEIPVCFQIYKSDYLKALDFIKSQCPLYRTTSRTCNIVNIEDKIFNKLEYNIDNFFGNQSVKEYPVILYDRKDGRYYLKGLKHSGFTIRDFLVENSSAIEFSLADNGNIDLRVLSSVSEGDL
jgi:hypothetical protein